MQEFRLYDKTRIVGFLNYKGELVEDVDIIPLFNTVPDIYIIKNRKQEIDINEIYDHVERAITGHELYYLRTEMFEMFYRWVIRNRAFKRFLAIFNEEFYVPKRYLVDGMANIFSIHSSLAFDLRKMRFSVYPVFEKGHNLYVFPPVYVSYDTALAVVARAIDEWIEKDGEHDLRAKNVRERVKTYLMNSFISTYISLIKRVLEGKISSVSLNFPANKLLVRWLKEGYKLEARGRELSLRLVDAEKKHSSVFREMLRNTEGWIENVLESLEELKSLNVPEYIKTLAKRLAELLIAIENDVKNGVLTPATWAALRNLDYEFRKVFGKGFYWAVRESFASLINSVTSAYHRILEAVQKLQKQRYMILTNNPHAEEWVKHFFYALSTLINSGLYVSSNDLKPTSITVTDDEIIMRLGSSPGHACHVNYKKGVLEYYDTDEDVKEIMLELIKHFVPIRHYEINKEMLKVEFEPIPDNINKIVSVMPFAISMDFRISLSPKNVFDLVSHLLKEGKTSEAEDLMVKVTGIPKEEIKKMILFVKKLNENIREDAFYEWSKEEFYKIRELILWLEKYVNKQPIMI